MGNKPTKKEEVRGEILVKVAPPVDRANIRWLARDVERLHAFTPKNPRALKPPEHVTEYMRLYGWLDLDMNDPDLAPLFK
ncbi:hypothetical protein AXF42_Ash005720 [Apostasia shenzhenica]|uniref:Uncharacterized protein n=1 Tax=Apostasia shenzhenica TaxID=1088818 RepID=A0A2I0BC66_9ASPA|nr:hypothetical protein AXF42_Ash005720 [Apostasia shenzhenica]